MSLQAMSGRPPITNSLPGTRDTTARHGVVRGHVVAAVGMLRARIAESWTLALLAEEVHLSRSQLARSFDPTGRQT